jgi:hypothetical protein
MRVTNYVQSWPALASKTQVDDKQARTEIRGVSTLDQIAAILSSRDGPNWPQN